MSVAAVSANQRYSRANPCPICGGAASDPRGQGRRCIGFLSEDGRYARCSRENYAGNAGLETSSECYVHVLTGRCKCGATHGAQDAGEAESVHVYESENRALLYRVHRVGTGKAKKIWQSYAAGSDSKTVRRVLFRLPELVASPSTEVVWIPEGEKCVDSMRAHGLTATCADGGTGGAGRWADPALREPLRDRDVVVLADDDADGKGVKLARTIAGYCQGLTRSVRVIERLPGAHDIYDWFANGGTAEQLRGLLAATPIACSTTAPKSSAHVITMSDVKPEEIRWLWRGYLPFAKISIVDGDPGLGKSTMLVDIVARVTTGRALPGEAAGRPPAAVVLIAHEDGLADTLRPRLDAARADVSRVFVIDNINGQMPVIPGDLGEIEKVVMERKAVLLVLDPFLAYLDSQKDSYKDSDIRSALAPFCAMAERTGVAVVLVRHLKKSGGVSALHRGGGSIGIIGVARSGLLVAADPQDPDARILASVKSNIAKPAPSLRWRFAGGTPPHIEWIGVSSATADELVNVVVVDSEAKSAQAEAEAFLREALASGPRPSEEVKAEALAVGITWATLRRVRERVAKARKQGFSGRWTWELAGQESASLPIVKNELLREEWTPNPPPITEEAQEAQEDHGGGKVLTEDFFDEASVGPGFREGNL